MFVLFFPLWFNVKFASASAAAGETTSPAWKMGISGFNQSIISWEGCNSYITGILLWSSVCVVIILCETLQQRCLLLEECWLTSKINRNNSNKCSIYFLHKVADIPCLLSYIFLDVLSNNARIVRNYPFYQFKAWPYDLSS